MHSPLMSCQMMPRTKTLVALIALIRLQVEMHNVHVLSLCIGAAKRSVAELATVPFDGIRPMNLLTVIPQHGVRQKLRVANITLEMIPVLVRGQVDLKIGVVFELHFTDCAGDQFYVVVRHLKMLLEVHFCVEIVIANVTDVAYRY